MTIEITTLGGGCFWCLEAAFQVIKGVESVVSGYAGGNREHPSYRDVCNGRTGHAEVVQITFDQDLLDFGRLLEIFFTIHDPTQLNRQGPDVGHQNRSVIHFYDADQEHGARDVRTALSTANRYPHPIVTAIEPAATFWPAEEYHQKYVQKHGGGGCKV